MDIFPYLYYCCPAFDKVFKIYEDRVGYYTMAGIVVVLTRYVLDTVWVQGQVPVEPAERKVGRLQFAFGTSGRNGAVLVMERIARRRVVVVLDLVVVVHQPGRERRGHAEFRVVERAHVSDGELQLELTVCVREIPAVQIANRYVVPVSLGRTFCGELYLQKPTRTGHNHI